MEVHLKYPPVFKALQSEYLTNTINHSLKESTFPEKSKQSEVILIFKKLDPLVYRRRIMDL